MAALLALCEACILRLIFTGSKIRVVVSQSKIIEFDLPTPGLTIGELPCTGSLLKACYNQSCFDINEKGNGRTLTITSDNLVALHFKYDQARRRFVEWAQNEIAVVPDFHKRILFSDEAHFWLNGYVNKQNGRIWSEANPQVYVETPLHPEKLTVWCALWAGGILLQKR
ncbi:hypothetical protein TNCV_4183181 [Trichonephila clavipes]|nr:hypothetical protein TNCV_4183181 [Trichonephila clavipes]